MTAEVHQHSQDGVAILTLDRPVANALAPSLRRDLETALQAAIDNPEICAIVLTGAGTGFSSGLDITEFDSPARAPTLADLCLMIEESPKPVVAALHGSALGAVSNWRWRRISGSRPKGPSWACPRSASG